MLSIITPVHNEEKIIEDFVKNAVGFLRKKKIDGEVLVVENGSKDKTLEILKKLEFKELKIISLQVGNKGLALKKGIEAAKGEYLITLDTDLWDEKFVEASIKNLDDYDIVIGSKSVIGAKDKRSFPVRFIKWGYNFVMRLFFDFQGTETHARLSFRKKAILSLVRKCKTSELVFDTELILRAERAGLSKMEIPTEVQEIRQRRFGSIDQMIKTIKNCFVLLFAIGPKPNWSYILVFTALILGTFLRFYHYYDWFFFSVDEEHYSFMTRMITVDHHFPLIGGPISGTKLYMAPWFLYFNAVWFWLSNNNPVFSGAVFTILELGVVIIIYLLGKKLFSAKAGAVGALLYAGSFLLTLFDRHYWNITLTPLISILTFYGLLRYLEGSRKWLIVTALVLGFGLSSTFSVFAVFLFALLVLVLYKKRDLSLFLGIIALMHLPLLFFDLRHDFWLWRALFSVHAAGSVTGNAFELLIQTLGKALVITSPLDVSNETSICDIKHYAPEVWAVVLGLISMMGIIFSKRKILIGLLLFINIFSLFLFRAEPGERHFLPFLPVFFVLAGIVLAKLPKIVTTVIIISLLAINFSSFINSYASFGILKKENIVKNIITKTKAGEFYLDSVGSCHKWGYRYLFSEFNHEPAASYLDADFSWMYSQKPDISKVKTYEIIRE